MHHTWNLDLISHHCPCVLVVGWSSLEVEVLLLLFGRPVEEEGWCFDKPSMNGGGVIQAQIVNCQEGAKAGGDTLT